MQWNSFYLLGTSDITNNPSDDSKTVFVPTSYGILVWRLGLPPNLAFSFYVLQCTSSRFIHSLYTLYAPIINDDNT